MVDISSQNNKINVTVSSSGNTANTNVTPDYARYYSEKSKEWAISNRIVDNEDYSSKYYANESKKQADISTAKATEVVESGNNAVLNIENARDNAIIDITNQGNVSVDNVNTAGAMQIALATEQANIAKEQATIATNKTSEVIASGNEALSNIDTAKSEALTEIETLHSSSVDDITDLKNTSISDITTAKDNAITSITEIKLNNPYSLFDSKYSDHELNNLSWLKSEGQWNSGTVYVDAYNELLREYNDSTSVEETEDSITFKRTPKGYKIALKDQETAINTKYATDGIAWYYIIDTVNSQFKLPRTKFGFKGLRTSVGDDIAERLPNIKGDIGRFQAYEFQTKNPFYIHDRDTVNNISGVTTANATGYGMKIGIDASRVSSTYQDGAPVQERATQMYLYFYVGETVQNANLIDAGRIGEQLTNKADIDLNNLSSTGVEKFDGPWVSCNEYQIFSNVGLSSSTYSEYTLDFLSDNGVFELNCMYTTNAGANNGYARLVLNDESESYRFVVGANTGTAYNAFIYGQVNLIVSNKKVKAMKVGGGNGNEKFSLIAVAYRKVGTGF